MINIILGYGDMPANEARAVIQDIWDAAELETPAGQPVNQNFILEVQPEPGAAHSAILEWLHSNGLDYQVLTLGSRPTNVAYNGAAQEIDVEQFAIPALVAHWSGSDEVRILSLLLSPYESVEEDAYTSSIIETCVNMPNVTAFAANAQMWQMQPVDPAQLVEDPTQTAVAATPEPVAQAAESVATPDIAAMEAELEEVLVDAGTPETVQTIATGGEDGPPADFAWPTDEDFNKMSAVDVRRLGKYLEPWGVNPPNWRAIAPIIEEIKRLRAQYTGAAAAPVPVESAVVGLTDGSTVVTAVYAPPGTIQGDLTGQDMSQTVVSPVATAPDPAPSPMTQPVPEDTAKLISNLTNHRPNEEGVMRIESNREWAKQFGEMILINCPFNRERSLALTKLEESLMWANASIARTPDYQAEPELPF